MNVAQSHSRIVAFASLLNSTRSGHPKVPTVRLTAKLVSKPIFSLGLVLMLVHGLKHSISSGCNQITSVIKPGVTPYALKFYIYLFFANVLALVIVTRWIRPFGFVVRYCFWIGVCPSGDSRRLAGVWKEESVVARGLKVFLTLVAVVFPIACSPQSQTHPLDTAPIPANARILEEPCSPLGAMMCGAVSILSGETAVERRSACIIYVEPSGRRVEQCGSLPASHP